ncbi:unnamed protein product, partial [Bubo scandiacus]
RLGWSVMYMVSESLLHLGAACVLKPVHPLPRGLRELFVLTERLLPCGKHSTFSNQHPHDGFAESCCGFMFGGAKNLSGYR